MLAGGTWDADDVLLHEPSRSITVTAHKVAVNAVMAGCRPEYFPVVGAVVQAMGDPSFGLHAVAASTGPIRDELGIHYSTGSRGFESRPTTPTNLL